MQYLNKDTPWVAVNDDANPDDLLSRIRSCNIIVSDLDNTDAPSTGKKIVYSFLARHLFDLDVLSWTAHTLQTLLVDKQIKWEHVWHAFINNFINNEERERLLQVYTPTRARASLYEGVTDFYGHFCGAKKVYVTKTIRKAAMGYQIASEFDLTFAEQADKTHAIHLIVNHFPQHGRYLVKGDSTPDERMLRALRFLKTQGAIEDVVGINVCKSRKNINPHFDVNIPRDYSGLVSLL